MTYQEIKILKERYKTQAPITWSDEDLDRKIEDMIKRSGRAIEKLLGVSLDFIEDLEVQELLLNRVRYDHNNALELFETNFSKEILRLQLLKGVDALEND